MFTTVSSRKVQFRSSLAMVTKEFLAARSNGAKCRSGLYNSQQPTKLVSLFAIVDAHDDNRIGDEPAVVALLVQHLQSALDYVDVAAAMGQRVEHRLLIHRFGLGHADGHVHSHIVGCLADQSRKSQAAVMNRIEHRPLRGIGIIQSVHIHAHPHFRNAPYQSHTVPPCASPFESLPDYTTADFLVEILRFDLALSSCDVPEL